VRGAVGRRSTARLDPYRVHLGLLLIALPVLLYCARDKWFWLDDFDFLADRQLGDNLGDILRNLVRSHGDQLSTLQMVVYRGLYSIFGLHSYVPYVLVVIAFHLVASGLLWLIMKRNGVHPWVATVLCAAFTFFGAAADELLFAALMNYTAALAFGFAQLSLADHDGQDRRRDLFAMTCGIAAVFCSGVAVVTVAVVGVTVLVRSGWRRAALQAAPPAIIYGAWQLAYGGGREGTSVGRWLDFVGTGIVNTVEELVQVPYLGIPMLVALFAFLALTWRPTKARPDLAVMPLAVGAIAFFGFTALGRAVYGADFAESERYVYVGAALLLPALGIGVTRLLQQRALLPALAIAGAWMVIANVVLLFEQPSRDDRLERIEATVVAASVLPELDSLSADQAGVTVVPGLKFGQLANLARDGAIPDPETDDPRLTALVRGLLSVRVLPGAPQPVPDAAPPVLRTVERAEATANRRCVELSHAKRERGRVVVDFPDANTLEISTRLSTFASDRSKNYVRLQWRGESDEARSRTRTVYLVPELDWTLQVSQAGYSVRVTFPPSLDMRLCGLDVSAVGVTAR
jgi:hypothetical protein